MAATNVQSGDGGVNSPTSQRVVSSPWSQIVRRGGGGGESEVISPVVVATVGSAPASPSRSSVQEHVANSSPDSSPSKVIQEPVSSMDDSGTEGQPDGSDNTGGSNAAKKPVWNRPSNGVVEVVSPVMGAAWPALGESTKASLKSSSSESLKALSDASLPPALEVTGNSSSPHKHSSNNNVNSTSPPNNVKTHHSNTPTIHPGNQPLLQTNLLQKTTHTRIHQKEGLDHILMITTIITEVHSEGAMVDVEMALTIRETMIVETKNGTNSSDEEDLNCCVADFLSRFSDNYKK